MGLLMVRQNRNGFFKKQTNEIDTTMIPQVKLFLFIFRKKSKTPKNILKLKFGPSEIGTKFEKIFHLRFDATE